MSHSRWTTPHSHIFCTSTSWGSVNCHLLQKRASLMRVESRRSTGMTASHWSPFNTVCVYQINRSRQDDLYYNYKTKSYSREVMLCSLSWLWESFHTENVSQNFTQETWIYTHFFTVSYASYKAEKHDSTGKLQCYLIRVSIPKSNSFAYQSNHTYPPKKHTLWTVWFLVSAEDTGVLTWTELGICLGVVSYIRTRSVLWMTEGCSEHGSELTAHSPDSYCMYHADNYSLHVPCRQLLYMPCRQLPPWATQPPLAKPSHFQKEARNLDF